MARSPIRAPKFRDVRLLWLGGFMVLYLIVAAFYIVRGDINRSMWVLFAGGVLEVIWSLYIQFTAKPDP